MLHCTVYQVVLLYTLLLPILLLTHLMTKSQPGVQGRDIAAGASCLTQIGNSVGILRVEVCQKKQVAHTSAKTCWGRPFVFFKDDCVCHRWTVAPRLAMPLTWEETAFAGWKVGHWEWQSRSIEPMGVWSNNINPWHRPKRKRQLLFFPTQDPTHIILLVGFLLVYKAPAEWEVYDIRQSIFRLSELSTNNNSVSMEALGTYWPALVHRTRCNF